MKQLIFFAVTIISLAVQAQTSPADTSTFQGFKRQIENVSIIGLGETGHGYETINEKKSALVEILRRQLNFQAISFESSFTESAVSYLSDSTIESRARHFLYPFWNTLPVKKALEPFLSNERERPLIIGFDIQEDCRFIGLSRLLLERKWILIHKNELVKSDSILSFYIGKNYSRKGALSGNEYTALIRNYELIQKEIETKSLNAVLQKLIIRCIENRKWLCKYLTISSTNKKMLFRDSLMAKNIMWLNEEIFPDGKLIVWAANTHISKSANGKSPQWMGEWLSSFYGEKYFSVSFEKGRSGESFFLPNTTYKYYRDSNVKFNLAVYSEKLKKISSKEWTTACD